MSPTGETAKAPAEVPSRLPGAVPPACLLRVLDALRDAVMLVAPDRRLLYGNAAAADLLSRRGPLVLRNHRLMCMEDESAYAFARAVDRACSGEPQPGALVLRHGDQLPLVILVRCLDGQASEGTALLLASDSHPDHERVGTSLRECFGLTPSEAHVATAIAEGRTLAAIADDRAVSLHTIRTQVKTIAAKLRCRRQSEIAAIVKAVPLTGGGAIGRHSASG